MKSEGIVKENPNIDYASPYNRLDNDHQSRVGQHIITLTTESSFSIDNEEKCNLEEAIKNVITLEEMEDAKVYARELRNQKLDSDPDVILSMEEMVRNALEKIQSAISKADDVIYLLDLNEFLIEALKASEEARESANSNKLTRYPSSSTVEDEISTNTNTNISACPSNTEKQSSMRDQDIFSSICNLRGHADNRLAAVKNLMKTAKDEAQSLDNSSELRTDIRKKGGLHSLLNLFDSSKNNSEIKLATALTVAYLVPSFSDPTHCLEGLGLHVMECFKYLICTNNTQEELMVTEYESKKVALIGLGHLCNLLVPAWIEKKLSTQVKKHNSSGFLSYDLSSKSYYGRRNSGRKHELRWNKRREQLHDILEIEEILEIIVTLVINASEFDNNHYRYKTSEFDSQQDLRYNAALIVESLCAVEFAHPIAVREGMIKPLVQWLSSDIPELVRPAANAVRDLTSLQDEYLAGWIHSQIINEGALPAIINLTTSTYRDVRLAAAQILSTLSIASHARSAIVAADGLRNLVQLLNNSVYDQTVVKIDDPIFLAVGSSLLRIMAGEINQSRSWNQSIGKVKEAILNDILQGGALGPFVTFVKSDESGESIRLLSIEAIRLISENVTVGHSTRRELCDAGAPGACAVVMKRNISSTYSIINASVVDSEAVSVSSSISREKDESTSDETSLLELSHALHALANMLELSPQEEDALLQVGKFDDEFLSSQNTMARVCIQFFKSGGIESLLWLASLPQLNYTSNSVDSNDLLLVSFRSLASLCPLLLSRFATDEGFTGWAEDILSSLTGVLKRNAGADSCDNSVDFTQELHINALRGIYALAEYEPLKFRIMYQIFPQLLQFKNDGSRISAKSQLANQVCMALGFNEDVISQTSLNDPKLFFDWFCLERSLIIQAMARDEIRSALLNAWGDIIKILNLDNSQATGNRGLSNSQAAHTLLRPLFSNISDDESTSDLRRNMLQQYANIYENSALSRADEIDTEHTNDEIYTIQYSKNIDPSNALVSCGLAEDVDGEKVEADGDYFIDSVHPFPMRCSATESDWIMAHRQAILKKSTSNEKITKTLFPLPVRVQQLLDTYFPSPLIQCDTIPLNDFRPDASFNFRALAMPERRYFSFRRESQILSRIYEKYASSLELEDAYWTLGFSNSKFAGEFAETLVQALYRCPVIQSISFSKGPTSATSLSTRRSTSVSTLGDDDEYCSTLLAYIAGSLPPWVTSLTYDNVLDRNAINALVKILKTIDQRSSGSPQSILNRAQGRDIHSVSSVSSSGHNVGVFQSFAIRNNPQLGGDTLMPFFQFLGRKPLMSLRVLDLSGNNLGDSCCAAVLNIAFTQTAQIALERLDLSRNEIRHGVNVIQVVRNYVNQHRSNQLMSSAGYETWCSSLTTLNLSCNELNCGMVAAEIVSLLRNNVLTLKSLNISRNGLTGERDKLIRILIKSLESNTMLLDLDLSENEFSHRSIDHLLQKLSHSTKDILGMNFLQLHGNKPKLLSSHKLVLDQLLTKAKEERVKRYFMDKQKQANTYIEDEIEDSKAQVDHINESFSDSISTRTGQESRTNGSYSHDELSSTYHTSDDGQKWSYKSENENKSVPKERAKITVLFSAPLVWKDITNKLRPIEMLSFKEEKDLLWQCFKEASMDIELSVDNATTDRLQAAITKGCDCLHYSGHGHPNYLTFEDGKGGLHFLEVNQLKDLISKGIKDRGPPFKFVFVSACHSKLAGETFVNAGVPHVVCCQQESQLMDSAALVFTRAFYLALAIGRTVADSFEIGRQAVAVAPSVPDSVQEMKKFILLPENGKHDVPVIDVEPLSEWPGRTGLKENRQNEVQGLPSLPQGFIGREVDMYRLINDVLTKRFISLVGDVGIGVSSLASAICHYISERKSTMIAIETIFYVRALPLRGDIHLRSFTIPLHNQLVAAGLTSPLGVEASDDEIFQSIFTSLSNTKALIVFDRADTLQRIKDSQEFPLFLSSLFMETRNVRVLVTAKQALGLSSLRGVGEHVITLGPLDLKSTVRLFVILCPHLHTDYERRRLLELLVPDDQARLLPSDEKLTSRSIAIFKILGDGIPQKTFKIAYDMTKHEYRKFTQFDKTDSNDLVL